MDDWDPQAVFRSLVQTPSPTQPSDGVLLVDARSDAGCIFQQALPLHALPTDQSMTWTDKYGSVFNLYQDPHDGQFDAPAVTPLEMSNDTLHKLQSVAHLNISMTLLRKDGKAVRALLHDWEGRSCWEGRILPQPGEAGWLEFSA